MVEICVDAPPGGLNVFTRELNAIKVEKKSVLDKYGISISNYDEKANKSVICADEEGIIAFSKILTESIARGFDDSRREWFHSRSRNDVSKTIKEDIRRQLKKLFPDKYSGFFGTIKLRSI